MPITQRYRYLEKSVWSRAGIPMTMDERAYRLDAKLGSTILGGLINDLINKMSPEEVADMLGASRSAAPGTERVYRGQFAERKLAA